MQNDDVRKIKDRLDILDVVGDRVRLHRSGRNHMGLCPFHDEKTPSFHVSQERQNYHCFGCGKGGDIFSFVMETEGIDFRQALELLAERAGIELTAWEGSGKKKSAGNLHEVMEIAGKFFCSQLSAPEGELARAYLERRNISLETASRFGLGWTGNSWDAAWRVLQKEGVSSQQALDAGLALEGNRGLYDRFRGRLIFPIRNITGQLIAFGGRIVDGEGAKYVNSPEGALYSKRRNLYLLNVAKSAIRERSRTILVEGYMDALRLHIHGYTETVASLGTSLTEEQARLLKRLADRCYICYDSDAAGQDAALRGMYTLQNNGLDVYVITLPTGKDPDDLLNSEGGKEAFEAALQSARPLVLQHLHAVGPLLEDAAARRSGVESLLSGLSQLPPTAVSPYVAQLAGALGLYDHQFWDELKHFRRGGDARLEKRERQRAVCVEEMRHDPLEAALCAMLWRDEELRCGCSPDEILSLLSDEQSKEIALAVMMESPQTLEVRWHMTGDRFPMAFLASGGVFCDELESCRDADPWNSVCEALRRRRFEERLAVLDKRLKRQEATSEDMAEFQQIAAKLKAGKKERKNTAPGSPAPREVATGTS